MPTYSNNGVKNKLKNYNKNHYIRVDNSPHKNSLTNEDSGVYDLSNLF